MRSRASDGFARNLSLAALAFAFVACGSKDETSVQPGAGSGGGSGSSGGGGSGAADPGPGGSGGSTELGDASVDATPDATNQTGPCVDGTLEEYCSENSCPAFADVWQSLRRESPPIPRTIVQRPCVAADGSPRVAVSAEFGILVNTYIYAAETLVSVQLYSDVPEFCEATGSSAIAYYGEVSTDCQSGFQSGFLPEACPPPPSLDAGVLDAGFDGGVYGVHSGIYECTLTR
ncbi:MAG TPA: hypothetical protein VJU61_26315 [Polyangiaceae bacterium]|nr:hypothetical protein [Polyangiaceae bacterium]